MKKTTSTSNTVPVDTGSNSRRDKRQTGTRKKPYEPAAGAVITASQLTNLVRGNNR